jgi:hypothetical protein
MSLESNLHIGNPNTPRKRELVSHDRRANIITETRTTVWISEDHESPGTKIGIVLIDATRKDNRVVGSRDPCVPTPDLNAPFSGSLQLLQEP